jgi:anti-sigma regulatory factor (Ser/Thr protein kinase)
VTETPARAGDRSATVLAQRLPARAESIPRIRAAIAGFAADGGARGALLYSIELAVTEAASNVVAHAYRPGTAGLIHVSAEAREDTLEVVVADDGTGLRAKQSDGAGLGLPLIAEATADVAIRSRPRGGTEVAMRFRL